MRASVVASVIAFVAGYPCTVAVADVFVCTTESHSTRKLRAVVPENRSREFVAFLEAGWPDAKYGLKYTGSVESSRRHILTFLAVASANIDAVVENAKPSSTVDFWFQACNTTKSWKPYWRATAEQVKLFGDVQLSEAPLK